VGDVDDDVGDVDDDMRHVSDLKSLSQKFFFSAVEEPFCMLAISHVLGLAH